MERDREKLIDVHADCFVLEVCKDMYAWRWRWLVHPLDTPLARGLAMEHPRRDGPRVVVISAGVDEKKVRSWSSRILD